jgi:hypothetical protein
MKTTYSLSSTKNFLVKFVERRECVFFGLVEEHSTAGRFGLPGRPSDWTSSDWAEKWALDNTDADFFCVVRSRKLLIDSANLTEFTDKMMSESVNCWRWSWAEC